MLFQSLSTINWSILKCVRLVKSSPEVSVIFKLFLSCSSIMSFNPGYVRWSETKQVSASVLNLALRYKISCGLVHALRALHRTWFLMKAQWKQCSRFLQWLMVRMLKHFISYRFRHSVEYNSGQGGERWCKHRL